MCKNYIKCACHSTIAQVLAETNLGLTRADRRCRQVLFTPRFAMFADVDDSSENDASPAAAAACNTNQSSPAGLFQDVDASSEEAFPGNSELVPAQGEATAKPSIPAAPDAEMVVKAECDDAGLTRLQLAARRAREAKASRQSAKPPGSKLSNPAEPDALNIAMVHISRSGKSRLTGIPRRQGLANDLLTAAAIQQHERKAFAELLHDLATAKQDGRVKATLFCWGRSYDPRKHWHTLLFPLFSRCSMKED